ncbi:sperm acrosome-associated protein 5 [Echinops telfairi]|uniref:Lysozyme E n=1 Tax=Echinops telfairi TaxID=9371 RepID=A0A077S9S1_ECHTE|nr:sperm acrosome-associated protein 5 [Echinops telfairi]CDM98840.1 TPA: lysozyme E [Echinops telfairi]
MKVWGAVVAILATLMVVTLDSKIYRRCELARKLDKAGLNGYKGYTIGDWLCLAHYESGFDTSFVDHNPDGSSEYGIFQLNSAWWCNNAVTPTWNLCHMDCHDLLNRHLLDDILCAKKVVSSKRGMTSWDSWTEHCDGHDLSQWLKGCKISVRIDSKIKQIHDSEPQM